MGVNYIYGTYLVLVGLRTIGSEPMSPEVEEAVAWLRRVQNSDGGWGETCESYNHPELKAQGSSTPSQTAWALLGLMAAGDFESPVILQGMNFLLERQNPDGSWPEPEFTGTGFPGHFYINYHQYRNQFPLTALGRFTRRSQTERRLVSLKFQEWVSALTTPIRPVSFLRDLLARSYNSIRSRRCSGGPGSLSVTKHHDRRRSHQ
jgi:squalene cyclase